MLPRLAGRLGSATRPIHVAQEVWRDGQAAADGAEGFREEQPAAQSADGLGGAVIQARQKLGTSERRTSAVLGIARSNLRYETSQKSDDDQRLAVIRLAKQYGRCGYRKICALLEIEGRLINHKKVERIWRQKGLQLLRDEPQAFLGKSSESRTRC